MKRREGVQAAVEIQVEVVVVLAATFIVTLTKHVVPNMSAVLLKLD